MSETPPAAEIKPASLGPTSIKIAVAAAALLILWLGWSLRIANNRLDEEVRKAKEQAEIQLDAANEMGAVRGAEAMASAVLPLLDLRSKGQLLDEAELQGICERMAQSKAFEFAAITDNTGLVIAASDTKYKGSRFPGINPSNRDETEKEGLHEVTRPVLRGGVLFGAVVVRTK